MPHPTWEQRRAFLFSHPRTASNLLTRMLSAQSDWQVADYLFFDAFQYTRDAFWNCPDLDDVPLDVREEHRELLKDGEQRMADVLRETHRQGKHVLFKDHAHLTIPVSDTYDQKKSKAAAVGEGSILTSSNDWNDGKSEKTNPTIFPDNLMASWIPIILIRNPILVFESWLRAEGEPYPDLESQYAKIYTTLRFQRSIFDWYQSGGPTSCSSTLGSPAIVLDADSIMENNTVIEKLCDSIGMDRQQLLYNWEVTPTPEKFQGNERFKRFLQTISGSTCVDRGRTSAGVCIEERESAWKETFGRERAAVLASRVRESWPDYQYLWSQRML